MKNRFLRWMCCVALTVALVVTAVGCSSETKRIRIGTAGLGGIYNELGNALVQVASEDENLPIEAKTTAGSAANLRLLSQEYLELAIAQSDIIHDAYFGTGTFASSSAYQGYSAVAGLYTEVCQVIVRADSDIQSIDELLGRTVSVGEEQSGTEQNANQILAAYGLSDGMLEKVNLEYSEAAGKLQSGEIDAFFCTLGVHAAVIDELSKQCGIRLLDVSGGAAEKLKAAHEFYTEYTIPAGTYNGQTSDVKTLGMRSVLVASDKLSENTVQKITALLFANADKLQYSVATELELDEETAVEGITIPFHKGAAAYYSSKNITVTTE